MTKFQKCSAILYIFIPATCRGVLCCVDPFSAVFAMCIAYRFIFFSRTYTPSRASTFFSAGTPPAFSLSRSLSLSLSLSPSLLPSLPPSLPGEGGDDRDDSLLDLSTVVARRQRSGSDAGAGASSSSSGGGGSSVANAIFGPGPDSPAGPVGMAGPNIGGVDGLSYSQEVRSVVGLFLFCFWCIACISLFSSMLTRPPTHAFRKNSSLSHPVSC